MRPRNPAKKLLNYVKESQRRMALATSVVIRKTIMNYPDSPDIKVGKRKALVKEVMGNALTELKSENVKYKRKMIVKVIK